ncbi:hypothetical protein HD554DRAFT_2038018 [Boletus coccyginus]|nr:hypothetical protein HD554DRAFT_2038018 [Boletus coccyginus]
MWYYVVTVGKDPGVYSSWIEAGPKTKNIPGGAIHQKFPSEDEAIRAFEAAKARGEVKAYSSTGEKNKSTGKSKNAPLSPLGMEVSLLKAPLELEGVTESTGLQTPLSSPASHSRVAQLRRTLRHSMATDSLLTSSPPTEVTRAYAPLYEEDDSPPNSPVARPSPHFTFTSSSSRAYPVVSDGHFLERNAEEMPLQLEVSDWDSPPPTPSFSDSHLDAEEHTSGPPRGMHLHPEPLSRSIGVEYRSLSDFAETENIDPRVWLPKSRVFDPDKIKPRPLTRPPSPEKANTSPIPSHETVGGSPQLRCQISLVDSPFVRIDRGRHARLTSSASLPILPDRELENKYSDFGSRPTQFQENYCTGKGREPDYSERDKCLAKRLAGHGTCPRNDGRSHIQLVPCDGRREQSAFVVHCPPKCHHQTCYNTLLTLSAPAIEPSRSTGSQYVDACVSPIIAINSRMQGTTTPAKNCSKEPDPDGDYPYGLAGITHVPHKRVAPETDVRSPIAKGAMVPMNATEMGRIRWKNASRARRLACLMNLSTLSDLACFSAMLTVTVLTHVFWAFQNTVWTTISSSTGF